MSVKVETLAFEKLLKDYAEIRETTIPKAVAMNARLLCVELARRTQPFGTDDKTGRAAVARDIKGGKKRYGLFAPITSFMEANAKEYGSGNIRLFVKKDGTVYGTDRAHFLPSASTGTLRSIHKAAFKNGRMSSAGSRSRDIGRWKFIDKYFVPEKALNDFVALQQTKVGLAKSGWAACAKQLPKIVSGSATRGIPRWVTNKLGDFSFGRVEDRTSNIFNPVIVLTNTLAWADKVLSEVEQLNATQIVARKMKAQMAQILKKRTTILAEAA
jgi:hypothetical protein